MVSLYVLISIVFELVLTYRTISYEGRKGSLPLCPSPQVPFAGIPHYHTVLDPLSLAAKLQELPMGWGVALTEPLSTRHHPRTAEKKLPHWLLSGWVRGEFWTAP